ncbi:MAG: glycosyltransferase 87 family protein, partial [Anaerolineae bacterium]
VVLLLALFDWRQPPWLLALTLLWSIIFYHSARTALLGQFAGPVFLFVAASLLALKRGRDGWAGLFLALATVKPQMVFLLIPPLLWWTAIHRRWWFWWGFGGMMAGLTAVSFLLLPGWLAGFVRQVSYYPDYTVTGPPVWVITGYLFPVLGKPVEWALSLALLGWTVWQWRHLPRLTLDSPRYWLIIGLTLVVTNSVILRTATTNYVVMYVPLLLGLKWLAEWYGRGWVAVFFLVSIVSLWALFFATVQGDFEHPLMYLPLPVGILVWLAVAQRRI